MESGGNDKRIQALYSELSLENQTLAPQFERVWNSATTVKAIPGTGMRKPLLIAAAVTALVCALAAWSWYRLPASSPSEIAKQLPQPAIIESPEQPNSLPVSEPAKAHRRRQKRTAHRWATTEAAMLSSWQSPTARFMESPTSLVMSSLPQLNQSVKELESFLPANNEIIKESNQ